MVHDVVFNDTVEHLTANKAEIAVNGGESTLLESPGVLLEVLSILVIVVEISDGNYVNQYLTLSKFSVINLPSQWLTQR